MLVVPFGDHEFLHGGRTKMSTQHQSTIFVGSFVLTLSLLVFGSRYVVDSFDLFPADPEGDPTSFKNILHNAWGSSSPPRFKSSNKMGQAGSSDSPLIGDNLIAPIGLAVLVGLGAIVAFFVFGKSKSQSLAVLSYFYMLMRLLYRTSCVK